MTSAVMPTYSPSKIAFDYGKGIYLYSKDGEKYIDFGSGIAVSSLGHSHPHLENAIQDQASKQKPMSGLVLETKFSSDLDKPIRIVLAGAAGQKVVSAGNLLASAATLSGLWTSRRADFPITIQTGFSVAEVVISPEPVLYSGIVKPDVAALIAPEGKAKITRLTKTMEKSDTIYFAEGLGDVDSSAKQYPLEFPDGAQKDIRKNISALTAGYLVKQLNLFPFEALMEAVRQIQKPKIAEINLGVLAKLEN